MLPDVGVGVVRHHDASVEESEAGDVIPERQGYQIGMFKTNVFEELFRLCHWVLNFDSYTFDQALYTIAWYLNTQGLSIPGSVFFSKI